MEPKTGDVSPALDLIRHLCSRAADTEEGCDEVMDYLLCWMAWPLQHRGSKLRTAVVMHGDEGAGKNFLFDLLVEIYGEYGATVGQDELEDKFNDWRSRKLMVVGDEVSSRAELVHNKNRLKALITSTTVQINPKNLPRREEANHINVAFLSNELQPLALDNSDRRYLVVFTPKAREFEFYAKLGEWKKAGGAARFYDYLLKYPCDRFDPYAPAPITAAKRDLIDLNRKSPERFWIEWSEGLIDLPYWSCTGEQAYRAYLKYCQRTGDRFPVQRPLFTRMVLRVSDTMGKPCVDKVMKIDYGPRDGPPDLKAARMLLVMDPPTEGLGAWATDCWRAFEAELRKYLGGRFGGGDDGDPPM
jgi:putative DNA primase/helicase